MDPLSVASGIVGIVAVGIHATRVLAQDIEKVRDVPPKLAQLKHDLLSIQGILEALEVSLQSASTLPADVQSLLDNVRIKTAVEACGNLCGQFQETLRKWTRHSTEDRVSKRDQFRIGVFGDDKIQSFQQQLGTCKATISVALNAANFIIMIQGQPKESLGTQVAELQKVEEAATQVGSETESEMSLVTRELQSEVLTVEERVQPHVQQQQRWLDLLSNCQAVCEMVQARLKGERTRISIAQVELNTGGKAIVGMLNVDPEDYGNLRMEVKGVRVESKGKAFVGIGKGFDADAFFAD